jgi:hypothetical protein
MTSQLFGVYLKNFHSRILSYLKFLPFFRPIVCLILFLFLFFCFHSLLLFLPPSLGCVAQAVSCQILTAEASVPFRIYAPSISGTHVTMAEFPPQNKYTQCLLASKMKTRYIYLFIYFLTYLFTYLRPTFIQCQAIQSVHRFTISSSM